MKPLTQQMSSAQFLLHITHTSLAQPEMIWTDYWMPAATWKLTDKFVKLRWQAAHVYSIESTTCDVSPNFLVLWLEALRRPRSSDLHGAEEKINALQLCSMTQYC
jgi:hypothetical protein